jgi:putative GTP pyrophosphokinase
MTVYEEKDYIVNVKPSGYRSYHLVVTYDVETMEGNKTIYVEIQIRTLAMNFWATIEHSLQYKYRGNIPSHITEKLHSSAQAILKLDEEMSSIHDEIMDAQSSFVVKANTISEILNNIQNLYKVANKKEVVKIQDEFFEIYKKNNLVELRSFARQLDIMAEGYRAQNL